MFVCVCVKDENENEDGSGGGNFESTREKYDNGDVDVDVDGDDYLISNNIEMLRKKIKTSIDDNRTICAYCNPTRFLLDTMNDERDDWENGNEDEDDIDNDNNDDNDTITNDNDDNDDKSTSTSTNLIERLKLQAHALHDKINNELDNAVSKEVPAFAEHEFNQKMEIFNFNWDINKLKSNMIYKVKDINLNSEKFGSFIDSLTQLYDKFIIVKPILSDPYSEEVYIVFGNKIAEKIKHNILPINREKYIDFLYCMYSYGIYVLNLVNDMKYKTYLTKSEFIKLSPSDEYKFIVEKCKNKLTELGL